MSKETGGPAFPHGWDAEIAHYDHGMTLRDYFAASSGVTWSDAVAVATEGGKVVRTGPEIAEMLACMRGYVADSMIAERAR